MLGWRGLEEAQGCGETHSECWGPGGSQGRQWRSPGWGWVSGSCREFVVTAGKSGAVGEGWERAGGAAGSTRIHLPLAGGKFGAGWMPRSPWPRVSTECVHVWGSCSLLEGFGVSGGIWGLDTPSLSQLGWEFGGIWGFRGNLAQLPDCPSSTRASESSWECQEPGQGSSGWMWQPLGSSLGQIRPGLQIPPWILSASARGSSSATASSRTAQLSPGMKLGGHWDGL